MHWLILFQLLISALTFGQVELVEYETKNINDEVYEGKTLHDIFENMGLISDEEVLTSDDVGGYVSVNNLSVDNLSDYIDVDDTVYVTNRFTSENSYEDANNESVDIRFNLEAAGHWDLSCDYYEAGKEKIVTDIHTFDSVPDTGARFYRKDNNAEVVSHKVRVININREFDDVPTKEKIDDWLEQYLDLKEEPYYNATLLPMEREDVVLLVMFGVFWLGAIKLVRRVVS